MMTFRSSKQSAKGAQSQVVSFPVTLGHIEQGERRRSSRCPVALAMTDHGLSEPFVLARLTYYTDTEGVQRVARPAGKYKEWIRRFDCGAPVTPIQFELHGLEQDTDDSEALDEAR